MSDAFDFGGEIVWRPTPEYIEQAHLTAFMRGVVASVDVVYFLLLVVLCLGLTAQRLSRLRETG